ncbi:autotransporter outer membrane beta-barrel domain-containing protein [Fusobacterium sp. FSA-380-WT-3A]|uniref:autotransporter family protein n=1 Tax=Fusobacterium sp. FSA-380-WT-3A TaxID=2725304 RepID=UPI0014769BBC|nr:autotransporter outer membrane beta-barrel domain-containing protein [Fusobacterium sp. FSA-380-WT-3A]NME36666.1 autotransporter domain-containing protein [Fusobacterium sp. FSA-380-WT-3A]
MKQYNEVEKSLKRYLKTKVKITMATVVGFLIAGTVSMASAEGPQIKETQIIKENGSFEVKEGETYKAVRTEDNKITGKYFENINIVNNGKIKLDTTGQEHNQNNVHGIRAKGSEVNITNNGDITVTKGDLQATQSNKAFGIEAITIEDRRDPDNLKKVEYIEGKGGKVVNNGNITITTKAPEAKDDAYGINIQGKNLKAENNGNIKLVGKGHGVHVTYGEFVNTEKGTIDISEAKDSTAIFGLGANLKNEGLIKLSLGEENSTNNKAIENHGGVAVNTGKIQITDKKADELKDYNLYNLFVGDVKHTGMFTDSEGNMVAKKTDNILKGENTTDSINQVGKDTGSLVLGKGEKDAIVGGDNAIKLSSLNIAGKVNVKNSKDGKETKIDDTTINLDKNGELTVTDNSTLSISNGKVNGEKNATVISIGDGGFTNIHNVEVFGNIEGKGKLLATGTNRIDGVIGSSLTIGKAQIQGARALEANVDRDKTTVSSTSKFEKDVTINQSGQLVLELGDKNSNALQNSKVNVTGTGANDVALDTSNISGAETTINLGNENTFNNVGITTTDGKDGVYKVDTKLNGKGSADVKVEYNKELYGTNSKLNSVNNAVMNSNTFFSQNKDERKSQLLAATESSIYSETVKSSYENVKLSEDSLLEMSRVAKTGEWAANGKALYDKNQYDKVGKYSSEIESSGLLGSLEYGLDDNTSVGFAFSGTKQDVKTNGGNSDGDLFYLGTYAKKTVGNYDLTAGVGYQLGKYDTDNTAAKVSSSDSYKTNSLSAYGQVKYIAKFDGISFEPKVRLGYTYVDQDNIQDAYTKVSEANTSTVDATVGLDLVKEISLDRANLRLVAGTSYTKLFGDTDKEFVGNFGANNISISGANLTENSVNFTLGAEVEKESGLFYNAGASYTVGSNNTDNYGANLGIGYKF